jgi:hypothetical protein
MRVFYIKGLRGTVYLGGTHNLGGPSYLGGLKGVDYENKNIDR